MKSKSTLRSLLN